MANPDVLAGWHCSLDDERKGDLASEKLKARSLGQSSISETFRSLRKQRFDSANYVKPARRFIKVGPNEYFPEDALTIFNSSSIANYCLGFYLRRMKTLSINLKPGRGRPSQVVQGFRRRRSAVYCHRYRL